MGLGSWIARKIESRLEKGYRKRLKESTHEDKYPLLMYEIRTFFVHGSELVFLLGLFAAGYFVPQIIQSADLTVRQKMIYVPLIFFFVAIWKWMVEQIKDNIKYSREVARRKYGDYYKFPKKSSEKSTK